ncbi:MAG: MFS transporter [Dehalococcoidia bacterium]|nr:MAG: MFS transporter [Dehalococcoidia bacterium]
MAMGRGGPMGHGQRPSMRAALVVFKYPVYRQLWISSAFAFMGMQMLQIARALLAWDLTHSFGAIGLVSLSFGLPMLAFSLVGGAVADRVDKRNLTLITNTLIGVLAAVTAVMVSTGHMTFEILIIVGLMQGTLSALGMPARTPLMAEVVGQENMMSAIAMSNTAMNGTRLFGPALAGIIAGAWGIEWSYAAQAVAYVLATLTMLTVPSGLGAAARAERAPSNVLREIGGGLRYVAGHPTLRLLMGMMFITTFFAMPYVMLLAGFVQRDLGQNKEAYGWLQSISGIGALAGSLGIATVTGFDRKPLLQWLSGLVGGAGLILMAVFSAWFGFAGAIAATLVLGLFLTAYQTLNSTMIMDASEPQYYGRVMSINMLTFSAMPIMAAPLGAVADRIGASTLFVAQGGMVIGFLLLVALVSPKYTFSRQAPRVFDGDQPAGQGARPSAAGGGYAGVSARRP